MLPYCHCEPTEGRRGSLNLNDPKTVYFLRRPEAEPVPAKAGSRTNLETQRKSTSGGINSQNLQVS
jgi:hypothetical protein